MSVDIPSYLGHNSPGCVELLTEVVAVIEHYMLDEFSSIVLVGAVETTIEKEGLAMINLVQYPGTLLGI